MNFRLPKKDSATRRAIKVAIIQFIVSLIAFLADPEVAKMLINYFPQFTAFIVTATPIIVLIYNIFARKDVKNY